MDSVKRMIPLGLFSLLVVTAAALLVSHGVTVLAPVFSDESENSLPTVVVDPGHGGEDGGAVSLTGRRESEINLEISLRVRDLLGFLGFPVVMTRQTDVSIHSPQAATLSERKVSDLKNRVKLVGEQGDAVLLSIHQNIYSEGIYRGAQVFYGPSRGSQRLAEELQGLFTSRLDPSNHRQAKEIQSIYLLNNIRCPGVLIECGFLSNPAEEALLQREDHQKKLSAVICAGLWQYLLVKDQG
ncbi:MAG: N-acetylmuramoyl-L-alanine amidase [Oscillospiraceae bacterium]|nr:N-acetylmuramoyl-L-alanine amidase [Oscillospiraceae bacterium]